MRDNDNDLSLHELPLIKLDIITLKDVARSWSAHNTRNSETINKGRDVGNNNKNNIPLPNK